MQESRRAFWVIKHGIKMSAMPAWGKTLNDAQIWDVVAFVRKLPSMTPEDYQQLLQRP
jgi:mono/diheme cytochrome c family protein